MLSFFRKKADPAASRRAEAERVAKDNVAGWEAMFSKLIAGGDEVKIFILYQTLQLQRDMFTAKFGDVDGYKKLPIQARVDHVGKLNEMGHDYADRGEGEVAVAAFFYATWLNMIDCDFKPEAARMAKVESDFMAAVEAPRKAALVARLMEGKP